MFCCITIYCQWLHVMLHCWYSLILIEPFSPCLELVFFISPPFLWLALWALRTVLFAIVECGPFKRRARGFLSGSAEVLSRVELRDRIQTESDTQISTARFGHSLNNYFLIRIYWSLHCHTSLAWILRAAGDNTRPVHVGFTGAPWQLSHKLPSLSCQLGAGQFWIKA